MWDGLDHPHEEKKPEWYVIKWIIAVGASLVALIFGNTLLGILIIVAAGTLSLLASRPHTYKTYVVDEHGLTISEMLVPYSRMHSYEFVDRGHDHLLVIDTKDVLNPHLLIAVPDEHLEEAHALFTQYANGVATHTRGIPLSHTLMEFIGL
jgi:hypothetical protein